MKKVVVGLGEILWDVFPTRKVIGGAPANFAYHISQFGYEGYAVSAIGNDELGAEILRNLRAKEMNCLIEETGFPTGTVQVTVDKQGVPNYEICENVAWDNIPYTDKTKQLAQRTNTVCFGSLAQRNVKSRAAIRQFLTDMPVNSLKIFDINLRQNFYDIDIIHDSLTLANCLKINDEEVILVANLYQLKNDNELEVCKFLMNKYSLEILILTKGTEGSFVLTEKETSFQPTPIVQVADTVGAGDSFTAAFVAAYMYGERIAYAHKLAAEVSAYVCTQHGAMPKLPDSYLELFDK